MSQSSTLQHVACHGCGSPTVTRIATAGRHVGHVVYNCKTCGGYGYPFLGITGQSKFHDQPQPSQPQPPPQPSPAPPMHPSGIQFIQHPQQSILPTPTGQPHAAIARTTQAIFALQREIEALRFIVSQNTASISHMAQTLQAASFGGNPTHFSDSQAE